MKKSIGIAWITAALSVSFVVPAGDIHAAEQQVRVTLPTFPVTLNGIQVSNESREYPLIVYRDITYFPMTWYDSRLLGLEAEWNGENGLSIEQGNVTSSYVPYKIDWKNSSSYYASIPSSWIHLNGNSINNSDEEYPLLSFRNVTYFPLTWRFAHDEFDWDYQWDASKGLAIQSSNPQLKTIQLPAEAGENDVAAFEGYYYFALTNGDTNEIYRSPVDNPSNKELIYSYSIQSSYGAHPMLSFFIDDNELWFWYHFGGATMGSDRYIRISKNGSADEMYSGYLDFVKTAYGTLVVNKGVPPSGNNLKLVDSEDPTWQNGRSVGDPGLIYGSGVTITEESTSFSVGGKDSTAIVGEYVYMRASLYPVQLGGINHIYKINLETNETTKVVNSEVIHFKVIHNKLYYVKKEDQAIYSSTLDGQNEQKLSTSHDEGYLSWFDELNGHLYYTVTFGEGGGRNQLYQVGPNGKEPGEPVLSEPVESVQVVDGLLICKLAEGADYGVKLLDSNGKLVLAIADQVSRMFVHEGTLLMVSAEDLSIKQLELKDLITAP
jgi:hypothetical protein